MRFISKSRLFLLIIALASACAVQAQQKVNAVTGILWTPITGVGTPTVTGAICAVSNYGQSYQNTAVTPNTRYHCAADGWELEATGVTQIIPGTNITCSPLVAGSCEGDVTVNSSGGGISSLNGNTAAAQTIESTDSSIAISQPDGSHINLQTNGLVKYNLINTNYVFYADSRYNHTGVCDSDGGNQINITAWSITSNVATVTYSTNPALTPQAGSIYVLEGFISGSFFNGQQVTELANGSGAGSGTFTFNFTHANASGTESTATSGCYYNIPHAVMRQAFFSGYGIDYTKLYNESYQLNVSYNPGSSDAMVANYATAVHPHSPAVTGSPAYFFVGISTDSFSNSVSCPTVAHEEANYQSLFTSAHSDGFVVVGVTISNGNSGNSYGIGECPNLNQTLATLNSWLRVQGPSSTTDAGTCTTACGQAWDKLIDVANAVPYVNDMGFNNGDPYGEHYDEAGSNYVAQLINTQMAVKGSAILTNTFPPASLTTPNGQGTVAVNIGLLSSAGASNPSQQIVFNATNPSLSARTFTMQLLGDGKTLSLTGSDANPQIQTPALLITGATAGTYAKADGTGYGTPGAGGSTVTYTTSQTASTSDIGKLVVMNCSAACAYTLPATQPSTGWYAGITSQGSTVATIALGGSDTFNGVASVPVLNSYRILWVYANTATATDYRGDAPLTASSPITLTPSSNGTAIACPTCSVGSGTSVSINGGATLGSLPITSYIPSLCADSSGSGTAQSCTTSPSITPQTGNCFIYSTTTTNSGTGLTVNIDALGAKSVAIPGATGWTTTLTASIVPANKPLEMCYDGTNLNIMQTGTAAGGSMVYPGAGIANSTGSAWGTSYTTTGSGTVVALATSPVFTTPNIGAANGTSFVTGAGAGTNAINLGKTTGSGAGASQTIVLNAVTSALNSRIATLQLLVDGKTISLSGNDANSLLGIHGLGQIAASNTGGTCAMSSSTSCTITIGETYTTPVCIVTQQSATLTGGVVGCTVSGTTVTITAATANSETWGALVFGNPN